jgi:hypothetical protein
LTTPHKETANSHLEKGRRKVIRMNHFFRTKVNTTSYIDGRIILKPGYGNLLALNSVRYMAGLQNVWNTSTLGVRTEKPPRFTDQRFDDGKI